MMLRTTWLKLLTALILWLSAQSAFSVEGLISVELFILKADPGRPLIYASDAGSGEIIIIDTLTEAVVDTIDVGERPTFMDISSDGRLLAVSLNNGSNVAFINLETRMLDGTIDLPGFPGQLAFCGSNQLFVGTGTSPDISQQIQIVDTVSRAIVGTLESREVLDCNRARAELVAYQQGFTFPRTDIWDVSVSPPVLLRSENIFGGGCNSERRSYQSSFSLDGSRLYTTVGSCSASHDGIIPGFKTQELTLAGSFLLEWQPGAGVLSPDGSRLFAAHAATVTNPTFPTIERHDPNIPDVHIYDVKTFAELARFPLSGHVAPSGLQVSSDGSKLFAIVETGGGQTIEVIPLGGSAFAVSGAVTSRDGTPVQAAVELITESGASAGQVSTDTGGLFEIADVANGRYSLVVDAPDFQITTRDNVVVSGGPLTVRPVRLVEAPADPANSVVYLGSFLRQILSDPTRQRAYVSDAATSSVLIMDTVSAALVTSIPVGSLPESMDLSEDGDTLFVSLAGGSDIAVVDLESLTLDGMIPLPGRPGTLAVCGTNRLYVGTGPFNIAEAVQVVDISAGSVVDTLSTRAVLGCNRASGMLFTWEQGYTFPEIRVWDVNESLGTLVISGNIFGGGCSFEADRFQSVFSPDDSRAYFAVDGCSAADDGVLPAFDALALTNIGSFLLEWEPNALALSPDGAQLFATHGRIVTNSTYPVDERHDRDAPDIHVFDTTTFEEIDRLSIPGGLIDDFLLTEYGDRSLAVAADGATLFANVGTAPNQDLVLVKLGTPPISPNVVIEKRTNGNQADAPDDPDVPRLAPGETVAWTYEITNTGEVDLPIDNVKVTDDQPGVTPVFNSSSDDGSDLILSVGETWVYSDTAEAVDLNTVADGVTVVPGCNDGRNTYQNTGRVEIAGTTIFDEDSSHYCNMGDVDVDGVTDREDNCFLVPNGPLIPDAGGNIQRDTDGDNFGNICDPDFDGNLIVNAADLAYMKIHFFSTDALADLDGDGIVNAADLAILKTMFFGPPGPSGLVP